MRRVWLVIAVTLASCSSNEAGGGDTDPVDPEAFAAACAGPVSVSEAIARRDMPSIARSTAQLAADAESSGDDALRDAADDALREGRALVRRNESADFYKRHLAAMESALSAVDARCR